MDKQDDSIDKNIIEKIIYDYIANNEKLRNLIKEIISEEIDSHLEYNYNEEAWRINQNSF